MDLVGNPEDRFSNNEAHIKSGFERGLNYIKPQSHIPGFGPGRAKVHPDLSNRGALA